ncbi:MAG: DUF6442 family protein [Defluviitaleaceae bacterium]|nr:DUF6442 family protein [Defluviitaleaceae bacterium]MCL2275040.1 DUF6442 family protein [Defluviitaleaceae bacterium]
MNTHKEEILAKSRQAQQDEGIEHGIIKGTVLGNHYVGIVGVAIILFSTFVGQFLVVYAVLMLHGAHGFGEFLAKYRYFKQKRYLAGVILFGIVYTGYFAFLFVWSIGILQGWWG